LLVWGAAINTLLRPSGGSSPTNFQPVAFKKLIEMTRNTVLTTGVSKIVRCIGGVSLCHES
jgi:hypothetical protein